MAFFFSAGPIVPGGRQVDDKLVLLIIAAVTNFALGALVLLKNPGLLVNRLFAVLSFLIGLWVFSNFMAESTVLQDGALFWIRTAQAVASLVVVSLLLFVSVFPLGRTLRFTALPSVFTALGLVFFVLSWTPLVMRSATSESWGVQDHPGPLLPLYAGFIIICIVLSLLKLYKKAVHSRGMERLQIHYLVLGMSITALVSITTNLLMPLLYGKSNLAGFGPSSSIIMVAFIAHTIVRYRLLKIRIVLRRGVVYMLSMVVAIVGFIFLLSYVGFFLSDHFGLSSVLSTSAIALTVAVLFQPLRQGIERLVDRYFYREVRDYSAVLLGLGKSLSSILNVDRLAKYMNEVITAYMHPDRVYIYVRSRKGAFSLQLDECRISSGNGPPSVLPEDSRIISALAAEQGLLHREELVRSSSKRIIEEVIEAMLDLGIDIAVPVLLKGDLTAVILLGPKLSADIYTQQDLGLLETMANQLAVAVNNAQLYDEVRRVKEYNENILAKMESGVITVDVDNTVVLCNRAAVQILGTTEADINGRPLEQIDRRLAEMTASALVGQQTIVNREVNLTRNEENLPLVVSTSLIQGNGEEVEGVILVFSDLSRYKTLEEERNQSERLAYIGSLAAGLAHEIKNPLVTVKIMADLLPERYDDPEFRQEFVVLAIQEIERIDLLISQLLGFAKDAPAMIQPLDVSAPLDDILLLLSNKIQEQKIEIEKKYPDTPMMVMADNGKLKQVFLNIVLNAVDFLPKEGRLVISIGGFVSGGRRMVKVTIANPGEPIPVALRERIFTPFFTTKQGGTGLGLSICRKIMYELSGEIVLEEYRDEMTRFSIILPERVDTETSEG